MEIMKCLIFVTMVVLLLVGGCLAGNYACNSDDLECQSADARLSASTNEISEGEEVSFDASDSVYEEIRWDIDGAAYDACQGAEQCTIVFDSEGTYKVQVKVEVKGGQGLLALGQPIKTEDKTSATIYVDAETTTTTSAPTTTLALVLYSIGTSNGNLGGKTTADAACDSHANKPSGTTGYAFASFDANNEIRDLPTNEGLPTDITISGPNGVSIAENYSGLLDGSIANPLLNADVVTACGQWWSFSTSDGALSSTNCNGGTDGAGLGNGTSASNCATDSQWLTLITGQSCVADLYNLCISTATNLQ